MPRAFPAPTESTRAGHSARPSRGLHDPPAARSGDLGPPSGALLHVAKAIFLAGASAPGPDGRPYATWKQLGDPATDLSWHAAQERQRPVAEAILANAYEGEERCCFSEGLSCFSPKKLSGQDDSGKPCYLAFDAWPLCIADAANRLIANAVRLMW